MQDERFWAIVEECHAAARGDVDEKDRLVKAAVSKLPGREAEAFHATFNAMKDAAFTWDLWAAAYLINGGCGDDTFSDFRASLISRGRTAYERAVADPDSLADEQIDPEAWFHEGFQYAVTEGAALALGALPRRAAPPPAAPLGERWTESTVRDRFPKLAHRLSSH